MTWGNLGGDVDVSILTESMSISWLLHCTMVFQDVTIGGILVRLPRISIIFLQPYMNLQLSQNEKFSYKFNEHLFNQIKAKERISL